MAWKANLEKSRDQATQEVGGEVEGEISSPYSNTFQTWGWSQRKCAGAQPTNEEPCNQGIGCKALQGYESPSEDQKDGVQWAEQKVAVEGHYNQ